MLDSLRVYKNIVSDGEVSVDLSGEQKAVMLKLYDYGVESLSKEESKLLWRVAAEMKNVLRL